MKVIQHIIIFVFVLLNSFQLHAQLDSTWVKTYGGDRDDKSYDMIATRDGGFLLIGSTSSFGFDNAQMYFLKLDSLGDIMWSKSHGGPGQESGHSVIQTEDGGYFGVGYTNSWGAGGFDMFFVKLDSNGNQQYEDYYGGSDWDFAWDMVETAPQEYAIVGETQSFGNGAKDGWILKYDGTQNTVDWEMTLGEDKDDYFKAIAMDQLGNLLAAGGGTQINRSDEDVFVVKLNSMGDTIWTQFYGDTLQDYANDITTGTNNQHYITGLASSQDYQEIYVNKSDSNGSVIFEENWTGNSDRSGHKIQLLDGNKIGIVGTLERTPNNNDIFYAYSYPNNLFYQGGFTMGSRDQEYGTSCTSTINDAVLISGFSNGFNSSFEKIILIKSYENGDYDSTNFTSHKDSINVLSIQNIKNKFPSLRYNTDNYTLELPNQIGEYHYEIFGLYGQCIIKSSPMHATTLSLKNLSLNSGIYFIRVTSYDQSYIGSLKIFFH